MREFLGPNGAATIVLLQAPDPAALPKMKDVRRLFEIHDLKYLKGNGWYSNDIVQLERVINIISGNTEAPPWHYVATTDYLVLPPGTKQPLFFAIQHLSILMDGFDLTNACMEELRDLLNIQWDITRWRSTVDSFYESLVSQSNDAAKKHMNDCSIIKPNVDGVKQLLAGYGDKALNIITDELRQWYDAYKWKS